MDPDTAQEHSFKVIFQAMNANAKRGLISPAWLNLSVSSLGIFCGLDRFELNVKTTLCIWGHKHCDDSASLVRTVGIHILNSIAQGYEHRVH
jgi:hypothetical protein